jgi:hypothetical protein
LSYFWPDAAASSKWRASLLTGTVRDVKETHTVDLIRREGEMADALQLLSYRTSCGTMASLFFDFNQACF